MIASTHVKNYTMLANINKKGSVVMVVGIDSISINLLIRCLRIFKQGNFMLQIITILEKRDFLEKPLQSLREKKKKDGVMAGVDFEFLGRMPSLLSARKKVHSCRLAT